MENDIIIGQINVTQLKKDCESLDAYAPQEIMKHKEIASEITNQLLINKNLKEIDNLAKAAYDALSLANFISNVTGYNCDVSFLNYHDNPDTKIHNVLSYKLKNSKNKLIKNYLDDNSDNYVKQLFYLYEALEEESYHQVHGNF